MAIVMQNNPESEGPVQPPVKDSGVFYRFCMYFDNNKSVVFSDSLEKMIARLIPGYDRLDKNQQNDERKAYVYRIFPEVQTLLLQDSSYTEEDLEHLLEPKEKAQLDLVSRNGKVLVISEQDSPDVISLKYETEMGFLSSLNNVGHISFFSA